MKTDEVEITRSSCFQHLSPQLIVLFSFIFSNIAGTKFSLLHIEDYDNDNIFENCHIYLSCHYTKLSLFNLRKILRGVEK